MRSKEFDSEAALREALASLWGGPNPCADCEHPICNTLRDLPTAATQWLQEHDREVLEPLIEAFNKIWMQWCRGVHLKDKPCEICQGAEERIMKICRDAVASATKILGTNEKEQ